VAEGGEHSIQHLICIFVVNSCTVGGTLAMLILFSFFVVYCECV